MSENAKNTMSAESLDGKIVCGIMLSAREEDGKTIIDAYPTADMLSLIQKDPLLTSKVLGILETLSLFVRPPATILTPAKDAASNG